MGRTHPWVGAAVTKNDSAPAPVTPHLAASPQPLAPEGPAQQIQKQASIGSVGKLKVPKDPQKPHSSIPNGAFQQTRRGTMKTEPVGAQR